MQLVTPDSPPMENGWRLLLPVEKERSSVTGARRPCGSCWARRMMRWSMSRCKVKRVGQSVPASICTAAARSHPLQSLDVSLFQLRRQPGPSPTFVEQLGRLNCGEPSARPRYWASHGRQRMSTATALAATWSGIFSGSVGDTALRRPRSTCASARSWSTSSGAGSASWSRLTGIATTAVVRHSWMTDAGISSCVLTASRSCG